MDRQPIYHNQLIILLKIRHDKKLKVIIVAQIDLFTILKHLFSYSKLLLIFVFASSSDVDVGKERKKERGKRRRSSFLSLIIMYPTIFSLLMQHHLRNICLSKINYIKSLNQLVI